MTNDINKATSVFTKGFVCASESFERRFEGFVSPFEAFERTKYSLKLNQIHSNSLALIAHILGPYTCLNLADVGLMQEHHTKATLADTSTRYTPKEGTPANSFNISMVPWVEFTGFNINVFDEGKFLLPIFTMGKFFERDGKRLLPLAIQVHHAVCDGYHVGVFVEKLQSYIDQF